MSSEKVAALVHQGCFEVVVPKLESDSVLYEKKLPLELIPFAQRKDKYESIGTAFLLKDNIFVTAAHAMNLSARVLTPNFFVRDYAQRVFKVTRILKYASDKDYVVFGVEKGVFRCPFKFDVSPQLNKSILAVGNALGEGIVLREGLLTSMTFEELDGKWKWLRFSAAASPGNSGGPLLDSDGKILGVVLRKSENENLNYALPIQEILSDSGKQGIVYGISSFSLFGWSETVTKRYLDTFDLPQSPELLFKTLPQKWESFCAQTLDTMVKVSTHNFFPRGVTPNLVVQTSFFNAMLPKLIMEDENHYWRYYPSKENEDSAYRKVLLDKNGVLRYSILQNSVAVVYLRLPDDMRLSDVLNHSKKFMDLMLKGLDFTRDIGNQKIKITSLGEAQSSEWFEDHYGRRWLFWEWTIPPTNELVNVVSLPTPSGIMSFFSRVGVLDWYLRQNLKKNTNLLIQDYEGTVSQWKLFLSEKKWAPGFMDSLKMDIKDRKLIVDTSGFSCEVDPKIVKISENTEVSFGYSFFESEKGVSLNIGYFSVRETENTPMGVYFYQYKKPVLGIPEIYSNFWSKLITEQPPFNSEVYLKSDGLEISKVVHHGNIKTNDVNYIVDICMDRGNDSDKSKLQRYLDLFSSSLVIKKDDRRRHSL